MNPNVVRARFPQALLAMLVAGIAACSTHGADERDSPAPPSHASRWAIHAFVRRDGVRTRVEFPPAPVAAAAAQPQARPGSAPAVSTPHYRAQYAFDQPGGWIDGKLTLGEQADGWTLLAQAAQACGIPARAAGTDVTVVVPPWKLEAQWYLYSRAPASCNEQVIFANNLLCVADRLAEVADSIKNLEWSIADTLGDYKLIIPPQKSSDRFIARDLALYTLAHIPYLDMRTVSPTGTSDAPCLEAYKAVLDDDTLLAANAMLLFGVPVNDTPIFYGEQVGLTTSSLKDLTLQRYRSMTHVLRAGAEMTRRLVGDGVYADLAAAC